MASVRFITSDTMDRWQVTRGASGTAVRKTRALGMMHEPQQARDEVLRRLHDRLGRLQRMVELGVPPEAAVEAAPRNNAAHPVPVRHLRPRRSAAG
jgi:hypothetical protein